MEIYLNYDDLHKLFVNTKNFCPDNKKYIFSNIFNIVHVKNKKIHRIDGPAYIDIESNSKIWYFENKIHRKDGPAIIDEEGTKEWWFMGKRNRENGPAVEYTDGYKEWWLNGVKYSEKKWNKIIKSIKKYEKKIVNKYARIWYYKLDTPGSLIYENRINEGWENFNLL